MKKTWLNWIIETQKRYNDLCWTGERWSDNYRSAKRFTKEGARDAAINLLSHQPRLQNIKILNVNQTISGFSS